MRLHLPWLLAAIALFAVEAIIATKLNHLHFIRAYFGDFLVVMLVYCAVKAFWNVEAKRLALGVFVFACTVELAQLFRLADVLHLTGWARVVLGTSFSVHDILMYAAGCLGIWWLDTRCAVIKAKRVILE
ncbi:DUF2809 domain-containing protein [Candidatus Thiothrix sp. Deng01]|uniref:DUF2809 domain-containing protein n=1 Tax=Candidatus Thiothrix phosphatis TaxID=3112415 RepID=A0ABU6D5F3_9GAMM|nr:DUF2809 domain-containing protein [Candidatus Thiothrix sp. Deng01]MEB4593523.1 DUF2809 domain-containing protein [Candidatus Thiothrix sp. Deng01]